MTPEIQGTKSTASPPRRDLGTLWLAAMLALVVAMVVFVRVRLLQTPFERDEGEFAYAGQLMLDGVAPYHLAYHVKLPGTYFVYAIIMSIFGENVAAIHFGFLLVNLATFCFLFFIARRLMDLRGALITVAGYALLSTTPALLCLAAHATHLVAAAAMGGLLLLMRARANDSAPALFWSGFFFGISFLCKQPGLFFGFLGAAILLRDEARTRPVAWRKLWRRLALFSCGLALPVILTCLFLWQQGALGEFWFWTVSYARFQAAQTPPQTAYYQLALFLRKIAPFWPFWILALAGLGCIFFDKERADRNFLILILFGCSLLAFVMRLFFHPHYFIVMLPVLSILIALAIVTVEQKLAGTRPALVRVLPAAFFGLACAFFVFQNRAIWFQLSPDAVCRALYRGNPFVESVEIGRYIKEHSAPEARVAVLGSEPQIYFYAHRHSATGYIGMHDLVEPNPYSSKMQRALIDEVRAVEPQYFLFVNVPTSWLVWPGADSTIFDWCRQYAQEFYGLAGLTYIYPSFADYDWTTNGVKKDAGTGSLIYIYKRKYQPQPH